MKTGFSLLLLTSQKESIKITDRKKGEQMPPFKTNPEA
jgi:hypothetical protein